MEKTYSVGDFHYDAKIYDGLNTHEYDLRFYEKWLKEHVSGEVLELCCGTGRLTLPLFQSGIRISGIDLCKPMLEEAKRKAHSRNLNISFREGDMRKLDFPGLYDALFIPFNSIHVLYTRQDFIQTMESVKNHLADDGYFLIDYFNPGIQYISANENKKVLLKEYMTEDNRSIVIYQNMKYESSTQINRIKWEYHVNGEYRSTENLDMRIFYPMELDYLLESNGFRIVDKYGDFDRSAFTPESPEQIYVCKKNNTV